MNIPMATWAGLKVSISVAVCASKSDQFRTSTASFVWPSSHMLIVLICTSVVGKGRQKKETQIHQLVIVW